MKLTAKQEQTVQKLHHFSEENEIFWDEQGRYPKFIKGTLSAPSTDEPETIARKFLNSIRDLLHYQQGLKEELNLSHVEKNTDGSHHLYFEQVLNDLPVFEGSTQVHVNSKGVVTAYKDYRLTEVDIPLKPGIRKKAAVDKALGDLGDPHAKGKARLVLYRDRDRKVHLAWEVEILKKGEMGGRYYFVDAHSGELLYKYAQIRGALSRMTYTAGNLERIPGTLVIQDNQTTTDAIVQAAHDHAREVYDYYRETFNRDSYDDRGASLRSTVHFKENYNNAFWSDWYEQMVYGDGDGHRWSPLALALDIVGHELTHAVTSRTARFVYAEEAGALDESFADIFGVMITNDDPITDWEMGEGVFTPFREGDALRDLSDPTKYDQPDHMDNFWHLAPGELPDPDKNDNGWVHVNSGIPNKAAYLIVAGGVHHGIQIEGIGRQKAEQIFYTALTVYLSSATRSRWTFNQARYAMLNACRQLYGDEGAEYRTIKNAWAAVGVGEPADEHTVIEEKMSSNLPIPDEDPAGVRSTISVSGEGRVQELSVALNILHTYIGDLRVALVSPGGERVVLHDRTGRATRDLVNQYDFDNTPELKAFLGDPLQGNWILEISDHARIDTGKLVDWTLRIVTNKTPVKTLSRKLSPGKEIPDNDPAGIESTTNVNQAGQLVGLEVFVDISHPYIGDLQVILRTPEGEELPLHDRTGYSRHDIVKTYSSKTDPSLQGLAGRGIKGNWTLKAADLAGRDVGTLNRWELTLRYE